MLDEPIGDGSALRGDITPDERAEGEDAILTRLASADRWDAVCEALMDLPPRERFILITRYLLNPKWKLDRLSNTLKMSRERIRQIEESADQILQVVGPFSYLTTSDLFDRAMADGLAEAADAAGSERSTFRTTADQVLGILGARKRMYLQRKPGIIALLSTSSIRAFLDQGLLGGIKLSDPLRQQCRKAAAREIEHIAGLMETEPMGLQFGLLAGPDPSASFKILRSRERAMMAANPFRSDSVPTMQTGVAMITGADEAIAAHQRVAEAMWRDAVKGPLAASKLREMLGANS